MIFIFAAWLVQNAPIVTEEALAETAQCVPQGDLYTPLRTLPAAQRDAAVACIQAVVARQLNRQVPIALDGMTTLTGAASAGPELEYRYRVAVVANGPLPAKTIAEMERATRATVCGDANMLSMISDGASYRYRWADQRDRPLHDFVVRRCP
jgi:hypothetical protein